MNSDRTTEELLDSEDGGVPFGKSWEIGHVTPAYVDQ
jgi:hypothetical protein